MSPDAVKMAHLRILGTKIGPGETVSIVRSAGTGAGSYAVHAWITGYLASDLVGDVQQGQRRAIVLAADVVSSGFPLPFKPKQDRLIWNGGATNNAITKVDDATRRAQGVLFAYDLELAGA